SGLPKIATKSSKRIRSEVAVAQLSRFCIIARIFYRILLHPFANLHTIKLPASSVPGCIVSSFLIGKNIVTVSRPEALKCNHGLRRQTIVQSVLADVVKGQLRAGQHLVTRELKIGRAHV